MSTYYCSGRLTWWWKLLFRSHPPFEGICAKHDTDYSSVSRLSRRSADKALRRGISRQGFPHFALIVYTVVRVFGKSRYKGRFSNE